MGAAAPFMMAGASVASGVFSAAGSIAAGNAAAASGAENARIMSDNAERLRASAAIEEQQGITAAARKRTEGLVYRGRTLAALSVSGVDATEGSPLEILSAQAKESEFQALQAKYEHDQRAWSMRVGAYDLFQRAGMTLRGGEQARSAAYGAAVGQLFGGAAKGGAMAYDAWGAGGDAASPTPVMTGARPVRTGET